MKVCIVTRSLPYHAIGGMEYYTLQLINGISEYCKEVHVITPSFEVKKIKLPENVHLHKISARSDRYTLKFHIEVFRKLRNLELDIIHAQSASGGFGALLTSKKKKIPLVITQHGTSLNEIATIINSSRHPSIFTQLIYHLLIYLLVDFPTLHIANSIISVSSELKGDIERQYLIDSRKIDVVPNGVDVELFHPGVDSGAVREEYGINDEMLILSAGRMGKEKGIQYLIRALPRVLKEINVKLLVVGTGVYVNELRKLSESLGVESRVIFCGEILRDELPYYYAACDLFVTPTVRVEGMPLVMLEAMACGKPVIASEIGGISSVIEHGSDGILIPPYDIKSLEENIIEILSDSKLAENLGKNAREKILKNFSIEKMVDSTIEVYNELIGDKH